MSELREIRENTKIHSLQGMQGCGSGNPEKLENFLSIEDIFNFLRFIRKDFFKDMDPLRD